MICMEKANEDRFYRENHRHSYDYKTFEYLMILISHKWI